MSEAGRDACGPRGAAENIDKGLDSSIASLVGRESGGGGESGVLSLELGKGLELVSLG